MDVQCRQAITRPDPFILFNNFTLTVVESIEMINNSKPTGIAASHSCWLARYATESDLGWFWPATSGP